jgi:CheY-like chemotaxis protein
MGENIKILLIEDNPGDVYLIEEHLEEFADFSYELKNVGTLNEALSVLSYLWFRGRNELFDWCMEQNRQTQKR